ncbi:hypothetical protein ACFFIX_09415 [Metabacillus herbersteinensis]|uniref:Uracil-DNA glycosylase n=1 Tax=Metabacillus herbersteinensis TaxID=283816 RepID=A0ABV6GDC1_9BACI
MKKKSYQVCASCTHFQAFRLNSKMVYHCSRLGFETKPAYSFTCWSPKEHIVNLMKKRGVADNE